MQNHSENLVEKRTEVKSERVEWTTDNREWYRTVYLKSPHWTDLRSRKLSQNPNCEVCGGRALDAHHVNYRRIFDVEISDLLSVCRKCHDDIHKAFETPRREKPKHLSLTNAGPYKYRIPGDTLSRALLLIFGGQCFSCGNELSDNTVRRISFRKKTNRRHKGIPVCRMCADTALSEAQEQAAREILSNADWDSAWKSVTP